MCGVSQRIVYQSTTNTESTGVIGRPPIQFDEFDVNCLSRLIMGYYKRKPAEIPTLDKIYEDALQLPEFPAVSRSTVYKLIKKQGFAFKKRNVKMQVYQRLDVVASRHRVLRLLQEYRQLGYEIFYQDELWCNAHHTREYVWMMEVEEDESNVDLLIEDTQWRGGLNVPSGAGKRLIINHIGSENGFLEGVGEIFVGKKDSADYHHEMNSVHFEDWWSNKVLPALPNT